MEDSILIERQLSDEMLQLLISNSYPTNTRMSASYGKGNVLGMVMSRRTTGLCRTERSWEG